MAEPKLIVTIDPLVPLVIAAQNESGGEKFSNTGNIQQQS